MRKDEDKAWFAEALLEESDTKCLIMCESVYEGTQCDTTMKRKVHRVPVHGQTLQILQNAVAVSQLSFS